MKCGTYHERLKYVRKINKLKQFDFGQRVGVTNSAVSCFENGKSKPSMSTVLCICKEFNVSKEWLLDGVGEPPVPAMVEQMEQKPAFGQLAHEEPFEVTSTPLSRDEEWAEVEQAYPNLSSADKAVIQAYLSLPIEQRFVFLQYCLKVAENYRNALLDGMTTEELEREYKKMLSEMRSQPDATASNTIGDTKGKRKQA